MNPLRPLILPGLAALVFAAGCRGLPTDGEKSARRDLAGVGKLFATNPPPLTAGATLKDAVWFAVRQHPQVRAAYADWAAAVERITVERSLPDPKLTFEFYVGDALTSLMPGLETEIPGPGKLAARAVVASTESREKYFQFAAAVQQTAFAVEKSFYPLHFLDARLNVNRQSLLLLANLEILARAQNEVGRGTLQDVLRAQMEQEKLRTDTANLEDSRRNLIAQFKGALGLAPDQADPPVPAQSDFTARPETDETLLALAWKQNPRLQAMTAEIVSAEAAIRVARKDKTPDFSAGLSADVKAAPVVWNPQVGMTLPVWRDKLAAELAGAQANQRAAEARLSAEQIAVAMDFAEKSYSLREADRNLRLLRGSLLPRARQSLDIARAAYRSGQVDFLNVIDAERSLLNFQLDDIAAQTQRELARAELVLIIAGVPPENAPGLKPADTTPR